MFCKDHMTIYCRKRCERDTTCWTKSSHLPIFPSASQGMTCTGATGFLEPESSCTSQDLTGGDGWCMFMCFFSWAKFGDFVESESKCCWFFFFVAISLATNTYDYIYIYVNVWLGNKQTCGAQPCCVLFHWLGKEEVGMYVFNPWSFYLYISIYLSFILSLYPPIILCFYSSFSISTYVSIYLSSHLSI